MNAALLMAGRSAVGIEMYSKAAAAEAAAHSIVAQQQGSGWIWIVPSFDALGRFAHAAEFGNPKKLNRFQYAALGMAGILGQLMMNALHPVTIEHGRGMPTLNEPGFLSWYNFVASRSDELLSSADLELIKRWPGWEPALVAYKGLCCANASGLLYRRSKQVIAFFREAQNRAMQQTGDVPDLAVAEFAMREAHGADWGRGDTVEFPANGVSGVPLLGWRDLKSAPRVT